MAGKRNYKRNAFCMSTERADPFRSLDSECEENLAPRMTPTSGPVGTPVTIHLKGVGWTEYDNIYLATYDNAYMGYACGFNTRGDVVIHLTAAGAPGVHISDQYPGIYQGAEGGQQLYRLPQLTYADDHPGNRIPALRFSFEVTPSRATPQPFTGNTR